MPKERIVKDKIYYQVHYKEDGIGFIQEPEFNYNIALSNAYYLKQLEKCYDVWIEKIITHSEILELD